MGGTYRVPIKSLDTPSHSMVFAYLYYFQFLIIISILKLSKIKEKTWNYVVNKNMLNKQEYDLYFRF